MRGRKFVIVLGALVLAWFIADAGARLFAHHRASHWIRQLAGNDPAERAEALQSLQYMGLWASPAAADMLRHGDVRERRASLVACKQVVGICLANLRTMSCAIPFVPGRGAAESAFEDVGGALTVVLADADPQVRVEAARIILGASELPAPTRQRAVAVLRVAMQDPDPAVRRSLVEAMCPRTIDGGFSEDGDDVIPILSDAVRDPDAAVRRSAVEALARGGRNEAAPPLVEALRDPDQSVRRAAERACLAGDYGPGFLPGQFVPFRREIQAAFHADVPFFIDWWKNGDPEADPKDRDRSRYRAIVALHLARGPEVIPSLVEANEVRALKDLADDADCLAALRHHIPALTKLLEETLYGTDVSGTRSSVESILRRLGPEAEAARSQLIARLIARLKDPDPYRRMYVSGKLGYFAPSSEDVRGALQRVEKEDPDKRVREAARESLEPSSGH